MAQDMDLQLQKYEDSYYNRRFELLIFTEAGKPVYSYTKREDAVTLMPLCSALIEYAKKTQKETLRSIKTNDNLVIRFTNRSPLVIIVIHETDAYLDTSLLVEQVEAQLVSILTAKTLDSVFKDRPTFDLKRLLYGSEKLIDAITNLCAPKRMSDLLVEAFIVVGTLATSMIPIVIMPPSMRDSMQNILKSVIASNSKNMVFTLLFEVESGFKLATICNHHDRHKIKITDIQLILALLHGSRAQLDSVESLWMPVCLPRFNKDAFVHSYIAYMNENRHCIVMMSVDRDEFANCQKSRDAIEAKLSPLVPPTLLELKGKPTEQLQFLWYQTSKHILWWQRSSRESLNPILYYVTKKMVRSSLKHLWIKLSDDTVLLGWHVPTFRLYTQFDKTITTNEAAENIQRITNWIKSVEDNFTIKDT